MLTLPKVLQPHRQPLALRLAAYSVAVSVLFYLTLAPSEDLPQENIWDKAQHGIAWMVLAGVGLLFWPRRPWRIVAFSMFIGALVEVLQSAMPFGRDGDVRDLVGDGVGVAAALLVWALIRAIGRKLYPQAAAANPSGIT
jgi:VanZ family protein